MVITCVALQNFLINESESTFPSPTNGGSGRIDDKSMFQPLFQDQLAEGPRPGPRRDREKCRRRTEMTKELEYLGRLRPAPVRRARSASE